MPDTPAPIASVKVEMDVPWSCVTNAITGAIEGGSAYWCHDFLPARDCNIMRDRYVASDMIWYDERSYWENGGKAELKFDKPTDADTGTRTIGKDELIVGLNRMARVAPRHFADLINENDDATTHDVFLQLVLFEEIIFG